MTINRKLSYSKTSKEFDLNPEKNSEIKIQTSNESSNFKSFEGYEKTDGELSYSIMLVISGGETRERNFLKELEEKLHSLRVKFISKDQQGLNPDQMQEKWEKIKKDNRFEFNGSTHTLLDDDKVYLVSDVDDFYNQLKKHVPKETRAQWIISNPCFEIWLYYCYKNELETDLKELESLEVENRSRKLKKLLDVKISGGANPCKAFFCMETGISNSKPHYREDENNIPKLYATKMYEMAEYIINTLNENDNEYGKLLEFKKQWREKWLEKKQKT